LIKKTSTSTVYQDNVVPFVRPVSVTSPSISDMVMVPGQSEWLAVLADRFDDITSLPRGWDGYGGLPVAFSCAQFAANLIDRLFDSNIGVPQLVPGSDGTLQIEWHENDFDIEVDVLGPYDVIAVKRDLSTGETIEREFNTDFSELADWIKELKVDRSSTNYSEA